MSFSKIKKYVKWKPGLEYSEGSFSVAKVGKNYVVTGEFSEETLHNRFFSEEWYAVEYYDGTVGWVTKQGLNNLLGGWLGKVNFDVQKWLKK